MKRYLTFLVNREVEMKTWDTPHTHYDGNKQNKRKIASIGEDSEKVVPSYITGGNVKRCNHCIKHFGGPLVS